MGIFDSVFINCPECSETIEFQSKVGECNLYNYTNENAPPNLVADLDNESCICPKCEVIVQLFVRYIPKLFIRSKQNNMKRISNGN